MDLSHLTALANRFVVDGSVVSGSIPHFSVYRRDGLSEIEATIYEPVLCLILQGSKVTSVGLQTVDVRKGDALLVSHDLPVVSRITLASEHEPYIALLLSLDLGLVRSLYDQVSDFDMPAATARSLSVWQADPAWVAPLIQYVELLDNPVDTKVLGPSILREIHYRLLLSPIGGMLRHLMTTDSHASRIAAAIQVLRSAYRSRLSVPDLAQHAAMSVSSFHAHFKSVTGTTPRQYQKDLRLIEARTLLVEKNQSVSEVAFAVGYESPTHFSRDYSRKFGCAPKHHRAQSQ